MKNLLSLTGWLFLTSTALAQTSEPEMADTMRAEGKIYVLVAIILIILGGLFAYLFTLDRKISQLENNQEKKA